MKKFLRHIVLLLLCIGLIVLGISVDLRQISILRYFDYLFWPLIIIAVGFSFYKMRKISCLLFALLCFSTSSYSATHTLEICGYYQTYNQKIQKYRSEHFKQDEACDKTILQKAREEAAQYKDLIGSCAKDLMSLCSEYDRRHPETVVRTATVMMNEPIGKSGTKSTACWPCDMVSVVFIVIQSLSSKLSDVMAETGFKILLIATAFFLLVKAAGMVLTSKGDTFFKQIMATLLGVMIVSMILKNNGQYLTVVYSRFLNPVISIGLTISDDIQKSVGAESAYFRNSIGNQPFYKRVENSASSGLKGITKTDFMDYCNHSSSASSSSNPFADFISRVNRGVFPTINTNFPGLNTAATQNTLLTDELKSQFLCLTEKFYYQSRPFIVMGQTLINFASHDTDTLPNNDTRFPEDMKMWLLGALLVCLFTYFSYLIAFRVIDIFLRVGFVLVLMPLFIAALVFPVTRDFSKKGWQFLFQIIVEFIGLSISVSFVMLMLEAIVAPQSNELLAALSAPYSSDYGEDLFNALTNNMTWTFPFILIGAVLMGEKLLKAFPIIIASLFEVSDSSKGGTLIGGTISTLTGGAVKIYQKSKKTAQTAAKNPHKTKENKAKDAEKDLTQKKKKLEDEKKKLAQAKLKEGHLRGTNKEAGAKKETQEQQKNVDKAQKDVDDAQKKADFYRKEADKEKQKTAPSQSAYSARRFSKDTANAIRAGGSRTAQAIDSFGSKFGGTLMKNGLGSLVGVPLVLGTKTLSTGVRAASKVTEMGIKGIGLVGAGAQAVVGAKSAPKKPAPKAPNPPPKP
jgi:hypothetical protein